MEDGTSSSGGATIAGRYQVVAHLGSGGLGSTELVADLERDGARRALKRIEAAPGDERHEALAGEFLILERLDYPHLVRVFDFGRDDDGWFLVEELVEGGRALSAEAEASSLADIERWSRELLGTLAYLHDRGIVHADVSPGNVLIDGEGCLRLIDFSTSLARVTPTHTRLGTPGFIAPEVAAGAAPRPASDLFAAGRLIAQMIEHQPRLDTPHVLTDLVWGLTERDPSLRIASAHQALAILDATDPNAPQGLAIDEAPLTGRAREMSDASEHLGFESGAADPDNSRLVVVDGPIGIGKSRLLEELATRARIKGLVVRDQDTASLDGAHGTLHLLDPLPHPISSAGTALRARLQGSEAQPGSTRIAGAPASASDAAAWRSCLAEEISAGSVCWLELAPLDPAASIDLARWIADPDTDAADIEALARRSGGTPLLLSELHHAARAGRSLPAGGRGVSALSETVRALPAAEAEVLAVLALLATPSTAPQIALVLERAAPEVHVSLRGLSRLGIVRTVDSSSITWTPRHGLAAETALALAAAIARRAWYARAAALRDRNQLPADPVLAARDHLRAGDPALAVAQLRLVEADRARAERLVLRADLLAELAAIEDTDGLETHDWLYVAERLERVGRPEAAIECLERARAGTTVTASQQSEIELVHAGLLKSTGRIRDALTAVARVPEHACPERQAETTMRLLTLDGRPRDAIEHFHERFPVPEDAPPALVVQLGYALSAIDEPIRAQAHFESALARLPDSEADGGRALAANGLGVLAMARGEHATAATCFERALAASGDASVRERGSYRLNLAAAHHGHGALLEALDAYTQVAEELRAAGARRELAHALASRANLLAFLGDHSAARALAEEAAALGIDRRSTRFALTVLATVCLDEGELDQAGSIADQLIGDEQASSREIATAQLLEAERYRRAKDPRSAAKWLESALERAAALGARDLTARALLARGRLEDRSTAQRDADLRLAASTFEELGQLVGLAEAARALAHIATSTDGAEAEAERWRQRANSALLEQARLIPDRFRPGFLRARGMREATPPLPGAPPMHPHHETDSPSPAPDPRLRRLLEINRRLASEHQRDRLLERILDSAIELASAERGFLLLDDGDVGVARNLDRATLRKTPTPISRTIADRVLESGETFLTGDALDDMRLSVAGSVHHMRVRSVLCVPCRGSEGTVGALYLDHRFNADAFGPAETELLECLADQAAIALENLRLEEALRDRTRDLAEAQRTTEEVNRALEAETVEQRARLVTFENQLRASGRNDERNARFPDIIGRSPAMLQLLGLLDRVAKTDATVLISGESGSGKELVARAIHENGARADGPFVSVNCGAIPETLLEATLFGHTKGSFTGADRDRRGLFEEANGGTLFLDEVGEMPASMQVNLLRALQDGEIRAVGSERTVHVDVRVLAATHRQLRDDVTTGRFRADLLYRLEVLSIQLPALRERLDDLPLLATHLLAIQAGRHGNDAAELSPAALRMLLGHDWPGNVRELASVLETARVLSTENVIEPEHLALSPSFRARSSTHDTDSPHSTFRQQVLGFERRVLEKAVEIHEWNVAAAARDLGLDRAQMFRLLKKHDLKRSPVGDRWGRR